MGASWTPGLAAALLLAVALALPVPASAGSAASPELVDPAGDQAVDTGTVPVLPGVNDDAFDDVDLVAAWLEERTVDCVGAAAGTCPAVTLVVQTTAGWRPDGTMAITFAIGRGPTSLPQSTATEAGTTFTLNVTGTTVTGVANATAAVGADGLRIQLPLPRLGATGGDVLTGLAIATSRFSDGTLQDVDADDQTGTDAAGPGADYTFRRPPVVPQLLLEITSVAGQPGASGTVDEAAGVAVGLRVTNLGLDADAYGLSATSEPPLADPPVFTQALAGIGPGESQDLAITISLVGMDEGTVAVTFKALSERGAEATARARITLDLPPGAPPPDREVKPAGLTFLTGAAESAGFDGPFGSYAELALLALLVLLALVALFLLLSLGRSTLAGEPAPEAPWPADGPAPASTSAAGAAAGARAGPAGILETVHASEEAPPAILEALEGQGDGDDGRGDESGARLDADAAALAAAFASSDPEPTAAKAPPPAGATAALPTAPSPMRVRIEEVRHEPLEPDPGQRVTTEVLLRNDGAAATLRVTLAVDGKPAAERVVQVPSRATKAVELPWTAGPGDNRVRIQAFPA